MKLLVVVLLFGVVVFAASAGGTGSNATDVEKLRQQLDKIEGEVAELRQVLQSLRGELDRLKELLDGNWTEVQRVRGEVDGLGNASSVLRSRIDELQRLVDSLYLRVSVLNSSLVVVREQLGQNWSEVQMLRGKVSSVERVLNVSLDAVRGELSVLRGELGLLRGWLAGNVSVLGGKADFSELVRVGGELGFLRLVVVGLGAVAGVAVVVAVLAWRRAGRGSAGGVEVCG
jgi:archaellum component FlaC